MNKWIELKEVPPQSNCPIFKNGMCMCASMACDDVKDYHCASMRYAFTYGFNTMVQRENEANGCDEIFDPAVDGSLEDWTRGE